MLRNNERRLFGISACLVILGLSVITPAAEVQLRLMGTTAPFATREIVVGPDVFDCAFCETITVVDVDQTRGLDDVVHVPAGGGEINVFLFAEVMEPSAGLMSMVVDLWGTPEGLALSEPQLDVVYRDVPGRTATYITFESSIPEERTISGPLSIGESGHFWQSWTTVCPPTSGLPFERGWRDISVGGTSLVTGPDTHTFGIGQTGNDQTGGATALLRFTVTVPPLPDGVSGKTFGVRARRRSLITFVDMPVYSSPIAAAQEMIEPGVLDNSFGLGIAVGDAPAALGDCDFDGDVDLVDFGQFRLCFTGPGGDGEDNCACHKFDEDDDIDLVDWAAYQLHFTGPGPSGSIVLPDPTRATVKGDSDSDGDIDYVDFAWYQLCFTGPDGGLAMPGCENMDFDDDKDVDLIDFGDFKLNFTGPVLPDE